MSLAADLECFLIDQSIQYEVLAFEFTEYINQFLMPFWQGSLSKIAWDEINDLSPHEIVRVQFPMEMDESTIQNLAKDLKFEILREQNIVIYASAFKQCVVISTQDVLDHLYVLMDALCTRDLICLFSAEQLIAHRLTGNFIELRLFESMTGKVIH